MYKKIIKIINSAKNFWDTRSDLEKNIILISFGCIIFHRPIGNFIKDKNVSKSLQEVVKYAGSTLASHYFNNMFGKNSESNDNKDNNM